MLPQIVVHQVLVPPSGLLRLADAVAEDGGGKVFEVGYLGFVDV